MRKFFICTERLHEVETEKGIVVKSTEPVFIGKHINEVVDKIVKKK